jgi:predicted DNA-binding transcriptional regulator AlpA
MFFEQVEDQISTKKLLTASEVARWLAVSPSWVRDHARGRRRPVLPCVKLGKSLRFEEHVIREWVAALRRVSKVA